MKTNVFKVFLARSKTNMITFNKPLSLYGVNSVLFLVKCFTMSLFEIIFLTELSFEIASLLLVRKEPLAIKNTYKHSSKYIHKTEFLVNYFLQLKL